MLGGALGGGLEVVFILTNSRRKLKGDKGRKKMRV